MNLYLRYFDNETLAYNVEEALDFLASIPDIQLTPELEDDIRLYAESDVYYPKRYKVRPRVYFIIIKTEAQTMLDFKQKKAIRMGGMTLKKENPTIMHLNLSLIHIFHTGVSFRRDFMLFQPCLFCFIIASAHKWVYSWIGVSGFIPASVR